ncbi:hypothetical protein SISNIDRAFT_460865 [Sistotremastrum niveocremeum HHB9708]|uniref:Uncharacterized protein n=1 Tax=Sistotremastrum niveocremeum HHB9708 TaxID=1314777 RepID=A0A164N8W0_9AGAM|nr:hypothetical protein SISNIDRAFT_460865 [Sistotremastrum niveocremeum HHB9708]
MLPSRAYFSKAKRHAFMRIKRSRTAFFMTLILSILMLLLRLLDSELEAAQA